MTINFAPRGLILGLITSGLFITFIAGCSGDDDHLLVCPRTAVLYDASRVTIFGSGTGQDIANLAYDAEIGNVQIECKYDDDVVISKIQFSLDMRAGPVAPSSRREFRYFVVVTELNQAVLSKKIYSVEAEFSDEQRRDYQLKSVDKIRIPFKRLGRGDLYEIIVGWDLTPEQLQYNRTHTQFERPKLRRVERP